MSTFVQSNLLKLALRVDPTDYTTNAEFTSATIGVDPGESFSAQRLLDIYNESRMALYQALRTTLGREQLYNDVGALVGKSSSFTFAAGVATKPTGYVDFLSLFDAAGSQIFLLPPNLMDVVGTAGTGSYYKETATNRFIFESGNTFISLSGTTYVPNASTYVVNYLSVPLFALADVTGGTTIESFNDKYIPMLLDLAEAKCGEEGSLDVLAMAKKLLGAK